VVRLVLVDRGPAGARRSSRCAAAICCRCSSACRS
jgi:hypothetical protein